MDIEDIGKGFHMHEVLVLVGGALVGATVVSWFMTRDPFAWLKGLLGMPYSAMAATTNPDMLQSYLPSQDYIYSSWPEDYPMYPAYTQRPYASIADDFTAAHGYETRPYQRSYHANQVVDNHEAWTIERDHDGNIIGISGNRQVRED